MTTQQLKDEILAERNKYRQLSMAYDRLIEQYTSLNYQFTMNERALSILSKYKLLDLFEEVIQKSKYESNS